jgi:hypothetical protein
MIFDLHVHTSLSPCGEMDITDIVKQAGEHGLDGVCITDHNTMDIRHILAEGIQENGVCVVFGMEYSTLQGDFLIFGPFEELPPHLSATRLLQTVRDHDGVAVAAHPFRKERPVDEILIKQGLCRAVECLNGRNNAAENMKTESWRRRHKVTACGGSDAHTLVELATFATRFFIPVQTRHDLIKALKQEACQPEIPAGSLRSDMLAGIRLGKGPAPSVVPTGHAPVDKCWR